MALPKIFAEIGLVIDGFEKNAGEVSKRLNAIDRDAQRAISGFAKIGDRLTEIGTSLSIGITAPLAAAAGAATKFATDFDLEMRKVTSLLGKDASKEFGNLSAVVLDVSKRMGVDAVKSAQALYEALSAGVPKENAATFLEIATKASIAGVTDTKVAVDALTSAMNAYGPANLSAKNAADQMFQAVNIGKFTFEQLAASLSIATPLAAQLGISFTDILAPAATLTSQGFSVSEAMTAIRSAIVGILSPNKDMNELLAKLNVTSGEALIKQRGLQGAFEDLQKAAGGSTQAIQEALGRVEGLGAVLGTTGQNAQKARADLDSIRQASDGLGASTAAYNEINKSAARQFEQLTAQLKITGIELGTALLPSVLKLLQAAQPLVNWITGLVKAFTELPAPIQTAVIAITAAVASIGPLIAGIGLFISTATSLVSAFTAIGTAITGIILPQIVAFGGAVGNVGYAVANGLTGALTGGEAALLSFGKVLGTVAIVAGTAFAAFKFGQLLYENIPAVKAFGDAIADLLTYIPGVTTLIEKLTGASAAAARATGDLDFATQKLEASLKAKGIIIERGSLSVEDYSKKLRDAAASQVDASKSADGLSKSAGAVKKAIAGLSPATKSAEERVKALRQQLEDAEAKYKLAFNAFNEGKISLEKLAKAYKAVQDAQAKYDPEDAAKRQSTAGNQMEDNLNKLKESVQELQQKLTEADNKIAQEALHMAIEYGRAHEAMRAEGLKTVQIIVPLNQRLPEGIYEAIKANEQYRNDLKFLGIAKNEDAALTEAAYKRILDSGMATNTQLLAAEKKMLEERIRAQQTAGEQIDQADVARLSKITNQLSVQKNSWKEFGTEVSTIITNAAQDMAKALFDGDLSFGERFINMAKSLGEAVVAKFIQPATKAVAEFISGTLADLLSGKGFAGVLGRLGEIGSAVAGIFGSGGSLAAGAAANGASAVAAANAATNAAVGAAGTAASAGGSAASGAVSAVSGLMGTLGAVGAIGSFASGVISNFQMSSLNKTMGRVEESTRYTAIAMIGPGGVIDTERTFLPWLEIIGKYLYGVQQPWFVDVSVYLERLIDSMALVMDTISNHSNALLEDIRGQLEFQNQLALDGGSSVAGGVTISVTGNTFATSGQMDQFADLLMDRVQRLIGYR